MGRKKKVTVKPLANTRLKPIKSERGEVRYPLYAQVSYNRLTTRIPTRGNLFVTEKEVLEEKFSGKREIRLIEELAVYEATVRNPEFTVRGFANVYLAYTSDFKEATNRLIFKRLHEQLQNTMSYSEYDLYAKGEGENSRSPEKILGAKIDDFTKELLVTEQWIPINLKLKDWVMNSQYKRELEDILKGGITNSSKTLIIKQIDRAANALLSTGTYSL